MDTNTHVNVQIVSKTSELVIASFGLVAALAWNDAVREVFDRYVKKGKGIKPKIAYATLVSIVAVGVAVYADKITQAITPGIPQLPQYI